MEALEIDRRPKLSREARATPTGATASASPLKTPPRPELTRSQLITLTTSKVLPARHWEGAVFDGDIRHASPTALRTAYRRDGYEWPAFVHGSRSLAVELNTKALLEVMFPDGVPNRSNMTSEVYQEIQNVFAAVNKLYNCKGMERIEVDRSIVIICDEASFCELMIETIASSGEII